MQLGILRLFHGLCHINTHFWQVHLFEFQHKSITEKLFLPNEFSSQRVQMKPDQANVVTTCTCTELKQL